MTIMGNYGMAVIASDYQVKTFQYIDLLSWKAGADKTKSSNEIIYSRYGCAAWKAVIGSFHWATIILGALVLLKVPDETRNAEAMCVYIMQALM